MGALYPNEAYRMKIEVVILAAGKGSRMYSEKPKVLHEIAGKALLGYVIDVAEAINSKAIHVLVGYQAEQIQHYFHNDNYNWILQEQQLGTAHAVSQAIPSLKDDSIILVLYGDVPLIKHQTLNALAAKTEANTMALLTVELDEPYGLGRIIRDENGNVESIVEEKDATEEQRKITEINSGIMAIPAQRLKQWLPKINNNNAQNEYYLIDIVALAVADGCKVETLVIADNTEVLGINNRLQLSQLERYYQTQTAEALMLAGTTIADPKRIDIRGNITLGNDVKIDINTVFEGRVVIGNNVSIGPNNYIKDSTIGDDVDIQAFCHIDSTVIRNACNIGPYARLRPGTELNDNAKVGNFVETKKAKIGVGSKVSHLTYIGDTDIGENVNIGAGTITCNYDGVNKFKTKIEDGAFVGSNTALVAPVTIGENATIAAGSTITGDVPSKHLAVARSKQRNVPGWKRPKK